MRAADPLREPRKSRVRQHAATVQTKRTVSTDDLRTTLGIVHTNRFVIGPSPTLSPVGAAPRLRLARPDPNMNPLTSQGGLVDRFQWHCRRLSTMTAAEVAWRCVQLTVGAARRPDLVAMPDNRLLRDGLDWEMTLQRFRDSVDRPVVLDRASARSHPSASAGDGR